MPTQPRPPREMPPQGGPVIDFLWFTDCPNHGPARAMLVDVVADTAPSVPIHDIDATDPVVGAQLRFPGSPTIRVDSIDVEPGYMDPGDYTPRCRLYRTEAGLRGIPERYWVEDAIRGAIVSRHRSGRGDAV